MSELGDIRVVAVDVFGTTFDWWTGVSTQAAEIANEYGVELDAGALASAWRERYRPSLARVRSGEREWAYLDTLHRESLDECLVRFGVASELDDPARRRLVKAWHRLPAWPDVPEGLSRLRRRYTVVALSNGGFAMLTDLLKSQELVFDAIISAQHAETYKPEARVYHTAADLLDVAPGQVLMVACHGWDLDGARAAGFRTAFVERPGERGPGGTPDKAIDTSTDLASASFTELADQLGC